jgi:hypothetical protein
MADYASAIRKATLEATRLQRDLGTMSGRFKKIDENFLTKMTERVLRTGRTCEGLRWPRRQTSVQETKGPASHAAGERVLAEAAPLRKYHQTQVVVLPSLHTSGVGG